MAATHGSLSVSDIHTSGQARLHIGDNNEHHDHYYYGDESQLSLAERQRQREDAILSSLYFADMNARERTIDSPCDDTFGWIFDEQITEREHYREKEICNLMSRWLEHEHGMFFIVGKAGSGKSTLMRFLAGHKQTRTLLESWAGRHDCALTVCAHYFWCSGNQPQSSQEGLWRSILYAIANSNRRLASAMFADRARDECQTLAQVRSQPWARNDLTSALALLVAQLEVQKVAVCLFIDGLDEYQGDEMPLIEELRHLLGSPYIKICASSRPRNLFEQAFGHEDHQWKLALHLLTQDDMAQLARTRLCKDDAFCSLVDRGDRRSDFITAITQRSQGVFLWTVLVIGEMIREAHQAGTIDELKERLDALPIELGGEKGMYQRIVERSDPRFRKYMARLLLVMLEPGHGRLFWEDAHFLYDDARDAAFATRECLGLDDKYRLAWYTKSDKTGNQLWGDEGGETSCRGIFLACHQGRSGTHPHGINCQVRQSCLAEDARRRIRKWCPDFVDTNDQMWLHFLHRSVGEYLSLPEIREQMTNLAGRGFDPVLTGCRLRLAHSRLKPGQLETGNFEQDFMGMIACVGHERVDFVRAILPEFERIQDTKWSLIPEKENERSNVLDRLWAKSFCYRWSRGFIILHGGFGISRSAQAHAWFLSLVARGGLVWYCREHWSQILTADRQDAGTIIIAGILSNTVNLEMSQEQIDLVQCLLCSGVDPNTRYTWLKHDGGYLEHSAGQMEMSLWEAYVEAFPDVWMSTTENGVRRALEVMQLLLRDGRADKQCLPAGKKSHLSALTFEPHFKQKFLNVQNR
jgi:energy-coupling factor transporter ATP-binding protein EcfA2